MNAIERLLYRPFEGVTEVQAAVLMHDELATFLEHLPEHLRPAQMMQDLDEVVEVFDDYSMEDISAAFQWMKRG